MNSTELEKALVAALQQRDALVADAAAEVEAIIAVLSETLPQLWASDIQRARERFPNRTLELGSQGVAKVKASLAELQSRANEIASSELGSNNEAWPHRKPPSVRQRDAWEYRPTKGVWPDDNWRRVRGAIGPIFKEFGLIEGYEAESWGRGSWKRYPFALDPPTEIETLLTRYHAIIARLVETDGRVQDLDAKLNRAKAQELWDAE